MMRFALIAMVLASGTVLAEEPKLPPLELRYAAQWNGFNLGEIVVTLKPEGGPDCYRYESKSNPVGLVRMFYGRPRETSDFCIAGGAIVPRRFVYDSRGDGFTLDFEAGKVRTDGKKPRDIPANAQDRFGLQQAVRLWVIANQSSKDPVSVEFAMVDDEQVRVYRFTITGRERIEIPAGTFDAVKVERVDNPRRISRFWIAPERDWMPVKVETGKDGKVQLRMELKAS